MTSKPAAKPRQEDQHQKGPNDQHQKGPRRADLDRVGGLRLNKRLPRVFEAAAERARTSPDQPHVSEQPERWTTNTRCGKTNTRVLLLGMSLGNVCAWAVARVHREVPVGDGLAENEGAVDLRSEERVRAGVAHSTRQYQQATRSWHSTLALRQYQRCMLPHQQSLPSYA
eukprot:2573720-Rhodomonas_salina.1